MTVVLLVALILLSQIAFRLDRQSFGLKVLVLAIGSVFLIGSGPLTAVLLNNLQVYPQLLTPVWGQQNVIVVLGGGSVKTGETVMTAPLAISREFEAVRLYHHCRSQERQCHVVVSGADPLKNGMSEAELMARDLKSAGVLESDITLESKSKNTFQNARFVSEILKMRRYDQTVLVTSGMHLRRARLYFEHFAVDALPAPADRFGATWRVIPLSFNFALADFALHEYLGIARLYVYNALGWNK